MYSIEIIQQREREIENERERERDNTINIVQKAKCKKYTH